MNDENAKIEIPFTFRVTIFYEGSHMEGMYSVS